MVTTVCTTTTIWITFTKEGIHKYPAAAGLPGVEFLQHPHRHIFHFRVELDVMHDDRDVEFILFKRELEGLYEVGGPDPLEMNNKSCEMLARELAAYVGSNYPGRNTTVTVSEDNENGATVKTTIIK